MFFVAPRTGIIGREEAALAIAVEQLSQVGGPRRDVVARIVGIWTEGRNWRSELPPRCPA